MVPRIEHGLLPECSLSCTGATQPNVENLPYSNVDAPVLLPETPSEAVRQAVLLKFVLLDAESLRPSLRSGSGSMPVPRASQVHQGPPQGETILIEGNQRYSVRDDLPRAMYSGHPRPQNPMA